MFMPPKMLSAKNSAARISQLNSPPAIPANSPAGTSQGAAWQPHLDQVSAILSHCQHTQAAQHVTAPTPKNNKRTRDQADLDALEPPQYHAEALKPSSEPMQGS